MPGVNSTDTLNVHSLAIQVPIAGLTATAAPLRACDDPRPVIGVWTSARGRRSAASTTRTGRTSTAGPFRQVSRLGNPLFNEVLIPLARKDYWNAQTPGTTASSTSM